MNELYVHVIWAYDGTVDAMVDDERDLSIFERVAQAEQLYAQMLGWA